MPQSMYFSPHGNSNFIVEIDGIQLSSGFFEVLLPDMLAELVEYRNGSSHTSGSQWLPGRVRYGTVVLRRGYDGTLDLYQWWRNVANGMVERKGLTVTLLDAHRDVVRRWLVRDAFPIRYAFSPLNSLDGGTLVETIELACEMVTME